MKWLGEGKGVSVLEDVDSVEEEEKQVEKEAYLGVGRDLHRFDGSVDRDDLLEVLAGDSLGKGSNKQCTQQLFPEEVGSNECVSRTSKSIGNSWSEPVIKIQK